MGGFFFFCLLKLRNHFSALIPQQSLDLRSHTGCRVVLQGDAPWEWDSQGHKCPFTVQGGLRSHAGVSPYKGHCHVTGVRREQILRSSVKTFANSFFYAALLRGRIVTSKCPQSFPPASLQTSPCISSLIQTLRSAKLLRHETYVSDQSSLLERLEFPVTVFYSCSLSQHRAT